MAARVASSPEEWPATAAAIAAGDFPNRNSIRSKLLGAPTSIALEIVATEAAGL